MQPQGTVKQEIKEMAGRPTERDGFYFADPGRWQDALAGALTSHLGGHGPLVLTTAQGLPGETRDYLESVRPAFPNGDPTRASLNRGYLVAPPEVVSFGQRAEIDWLLESVPEGGGGMHGMEEAPSGMEGATIRLGPTPG